MLRSAAWLPRSPWYCTRVCASARQHHLRRLLLHLFGALVYGFTWRKKGNQTKECITRGVGVRPRGRHGSSEIQRPDHSQRSRVRLDLRPHRAAASRPVASCGVRFHRVIPSCFARCKYLEEAPTPDGSNSFQGDFQFFEN